MSITNLKTNQMNKLLNVFERVLGGGVVGTVLDKIFPDKAEKMRFEMELKQQLLAETTLYIEDLQNAREMQQTALNQTDLFSKRFVYYLTIAILLNTILAGVLSFFVNFPPENRDLISMYYSFSVITSGSQVLRFFFGEQKPTQKENNNDK